MEAGSFLEVALLRAPTPSATSWFRAGRSEKRRVDPVMLRAISYASKLRNPTFDHANGRAYRERTRGLRGS